MNIGETMSKTQVNKILCNAGYTFGTEAYFSEYRRCFTPDCEGGFWELEAVKPFEPISEVVTQSDYGGFHTGSNDVTG